MSPSKKAKVEQLPHFSSAYYKIPTSNKVVTKYLKDENKPYTILKNTLLSTEKKRHSIKPKNAIAHWFTRDFRQYDNLALSKAWDTASSSGLPLVTFFVYCLEDFAAHSVSPFQLKYRLESLKILQLDLHRKNIPLYVLHVDKKSDIESSITKFLQKYKVSHVFGNVEYEVDELRSFNKLASELPEKNISFEAFHDTCVVLPGELVTKSKGTQYAVFTPWYRAWVAYLKKQKNPFPEYASPEDNPEDAKSSFKDLFESEIPEPKDEWALTKNQQKHFDQNYNPGEHSAMKEFLSFIKSDEIKAYADERNNIETDQTSHMSHHLASGTIALRSMVRRILENKLVKDLDSGNAGITEWIRQISWRDFYKHVLVNWPFISMYKPFQIEYDDLEWEYDSDHFQKWCQGKTGYPIVDACMRQLNETGYMHNRGRMIVASFLSKHLLIDWRYGERYFMEHLIDGDFASNNGGWGFSSGIGVDPQPYFRIFNPWSQAERFDKDGSYIKKWVPELKEISDGKGIRNPYENGFEDVCEKNGYPRPIVDHSASRERALDRYKAARY